MRQSVCPTSSSTQTFETPKNGLSKFEPYT
jgi:hypothetical protein